MDVSQTEIQTPLSQDTNLHDEPFALPAPGVHLFFRGGSKDETSLTIAQCGRYLLGRAKGANIRFSDNDSVDGKVSQCHAVLHVDSHQVKIANCAPRNGLKIDGILLKDSQELILNDTDVITLGDGGPIIRIRIGSLTSISE